MVSNSDMNKRDTGLSVVVSGRLCLLGGFPTKFHTLHVVKSCVNPISKTKRNPDPNPNTDPNPTKPY